MEVTWLRRAVAASLGVVALVVMVPAAGAITGSLSFRNSRQPVPGAAGSVNLTIARVGCFPTSFRPAALTQRPLTFAAALARANRLVGSKGARYTKLKRSRFVRTSLGGQRLATAAGLKGSPKGALAALLATHENRPSDPLLLIDAAAMLLTLDRPAEALAFLDQAGRLRPRRLASHSLSSTTVLLANRAAALVALRRFTAAAVDARRALRASPWLVEARETLGMALLCQNKETEAACEFRAAEKRPLEQGEERLSCVGVRADRDEDFGDLTVGKDGVFPPIGYPALPEKARGYPEYYGRLNDATNAKFTARSARAPTLAALDSAWRLRASPAENLRSADLRNAISAVPASPTAKAALAKAQSLLDEITALAAADAESARTAVPACVGSLDVNCVFSKCNPTVLQNHPVWLNRQTQLESTLRESWRVSHRRMDALLQNIADPVQNEIAAQFMDEIGDTLWGLIIDGAVPMVGTEFMLETVCVIPQPEPPTNAATAPDTINPNPCPPALQGLKVSGSLGEAEIAPGAPVGFGWEVNCSEVEVSGDWSPLPLLTGFGKLSSNFRDGSATFVMGSKAGAFGLEFTSEVYLSVGRDGSIRDAGWRAGPKAPLGKSDIVDIPIIKSAAPSGGLPTFGS